LFAEEHLYAIEASYYTRTQVYEMILHLLHHSGCLFTCTSPPTLNLVLTLNRRQAVRYQPLEATAADADAADTCGNDDEDPDRTTAAAGAFSATLDRELAQAEAAAAVLESSSSKKAVQRECIIAALQCGSLWFIAQLLFNLSLSWTSVTSNTILSSSSSLFTFGLSMLFLKEGYSVSKLLSIFLCIGGEEMLL
jgi:hypothetical protein